MNASRFQEITERYSQLKLAIVGDFCLDRYFEIDPDLSEVSIETGLEVHNVTRVRTQPGAGGTVLNNLSALGVGEIYPVGFCGEDGEGWLLERALKERNHVCLDHFLRTGHRKTFTYSKPLIMESGKAPRELNRLDQKNWSETPNEVSSQIAESIRALANHVDAIIVMDQVDLPDTGVLTSLVLDCLKEIALENPHLPVLADSRRGLSHYPPLSFKMNAHELQLMVGAGAGLSRLAVKKEAEVLAVSNQRSTFITLAEGGIVGAAPGEVTRHFPCFPVRGEIDIVGAGDSVTANLAAAMAANATLSESMELSMAAASVVIHQLGTTGTADLNLIRNRLFSKFEQ
jgi:rfaE bifunctional protein kinase chain/domain